MQTTLPHGSRPNLSQCLFATGRSCLLHLARVYRPGIVHLPWLMPEGLFGPFEAAGVPICRYPLKDDLEPDYEQLRSNLINYRLERPLVVLVHYFGYLFSSNVAAALAHSFGGLLLEDYAQCVPGVEGQACGDLALWSYNKHFPVVDGALLISSSPYADISLSDTARLRLKPLQPVAMSSYRRHLEANRILKALPATEHKLVESMLAESRAAYDEYYRIISADMEPKAADQDCPWLRFDQDQHRAMRIDAALALRRQIPKSMLYRPHDLPTFALPIRVENRAKILTDLLANGVIASVIEDKWRVPEVHFKYEHLLLPLDYPFEFDWRKYEGGGTDTGAQEQPPNP